MPGDVEADLALVEEQLAARLISDVAIASEVGCYAVMGGGKRVRPAVLLLFARALGADGERARDLALVSEWVHVASLLHDDVIDRAGARRGKPATHRIYGDHAAVMTGDYLLARAIQQLLLRGDGDGAGVALGAAVAALAEGELLEAQLRGRFDVSLADLDAVAARKTAALLAWSCGAGARAAQASPLVVAAAEGYGAELGRAFQLADDALDYEADAVAGKDRLADLRAGLPTVPLLVALERQPGLRQHVVAFLANGAEDEEQAQRIANCVRRSGGPAQARAQARAAARAAIANLRVLPTGLHRRALACLAHYVARRKR
jgi:octaprenyl-diphosphate synthase